MITSGAAALLMYAQAVPAGAVEWSEPPSRADHLAAQLRRDPVYVTDHAPRALPPDTAARIKAAVARLGVPAYVAVTPLVGVGNPNPNEPLVPLLHDRLRRDGLYLVVSPRGLGGGEVRQFGGGRSIPVEDAWRAAEAELPSDATAPERVERFVDIALSGRARERAENPPPKPKSKLRKELDAADAAERRAARLEWAAFGGGAALSGVPLLAWLTRNRHRRRGGIDGGAKRRRTARGPSGKSQVTKTRKQKRKHVTKKPATKKPTKGRR